MYSTPSQSQPQFNPQPQPQFNPQSQFNPDTTQFHLDNAIELAKAAKLAYNSMQGKDKIAFDKQMADWKFDRCYCYGFNQTYDQKIAIGTSFLNWSFSFYPFNRGTKIPGLDFRDTQAYLAGNDEVLILVFRGTENIRDWLTNFSIDLVPGCYGNVHEGFSQALDSIWDDLIQGLQFARKKQQPLLVTGHSLGGALATLAVARLHAERTKHRHLADLEINGLYTFGSPRVGDEAFAQAFNQQFGAKTFRFVNHRDIVTQLVLHCKGYRHVGCRIYAEGENPFQLEELQDEQNVKDELGEMLEDLHDRLKAMLQSKRRANRWLSKRLYRLRITSQNFIDDVQETFQHINEGIKDHDMGKYSMLLQALSSNAESVACSTSHHASHHVLLQQLRSQYQTLQTKTTIPFNHLVNEAIETMDSSTLSNHY